MAQSFRARPGADMSAFALKSDIPEAADVAPPEVTASSARGSGKRFARADHTHATSVQKAKLTLGASGEQTWTFPKPYAAEPVVLLTPQETSDLMPVVCKVKGFVKVGADFTGAVIKAWRLQTLPASPGSIANLANFNTAGAPPPTGVVVNCYASAPTAPGV